MQRWRRNEEAGIGTSLVHTLPESGGLPAGLIKAARERALASGRRVVAELEELTGQDPGTFVQALATTLRYPWLPSAALFASTPDFTAIPLAKALQHECMLVRLANGQAAGVLVRSTLYDALKANASDIHLETTAPACPSSTGSTACWCGQPVPAAPRWRNRRSRASR
jgi:hypothetical protein